MFGLLDHCSTHIQFVYVLSSRSTQLISKPLTKEANYIAIDLIIRQIDIFLQTCRSRVLNKYLSREYLLPLKLG